MTLIDPTTMTTDEYRAAKDREDGRGQLNHYGRYIGLNGHIIDVLDYTVNDKNEPVATVVVEHRPDGKRWSRSLRTIPLSLMFATKKIRPLGFKPVPWC